LADVPPDPLSTRAVTTRSFVLALLWIGGTALFVGLGHLVVHTPAIAGFDHHVTHWAVTHRSTGLDAVMRTVTWVGTWMAVAAAAAVVLVGVLTSRLPVIGAILFGVVWAGEYAATSLVKHLVGRARPPRELWLVTARGASFPSGHAANVVVVAGTVVATTFLVTRRRPARATAVVLSSLLVVLVACSRVELGVHWATDVVAGVGVSVAWIALSTRVLGAPLWPAGPAPEQGATGLPAPPAPMGRPPTGVR
jgi:membrane-associated phospholipid phosphatase